jgi:putative acetyltransferase
MQFAIAPDTPLEDAKALLREYVAGLPAPVAIPGFELELAQLPGAYAPPGGRLLVGYGDGAPAGCVALRRLDAETGELKRLYVREQFRGRGLARALVDAVIAAARELGYTRLRLDTHDSMAAAQALYASYGFRRIPAYWDQPVPDVVFFELAL